jgi:hypothetical protein
MEQRRIERLASIQGISMSLLVLRVMTKHADENGIA